MIYNSWDNFLIKRTVFKVQKYNNIQLIPLIGTKLLNSDSRSAVSFDSLRVHFGHKKNKGAKLKK